MRIKQIKVCDTSLFFVLYIINLLDYRLRSLNFFSRRNSNKLSININRVQSEQNRLIRKKIDPVSPIYEYPRVNSSKSTARTYYNSYKSLKQ